MGLDATERKTGHTVACKMRGLKLFEELHVGLGGGGLGGDERIDAGVFGLEGGFYELDEGGGIGLERS